MDNSHIGREHAHARTAIDERVRRALSARRFAGPGTPEPGPEPESVPVPEPALEPAPPRVPAPTRRSARVEPSPAERPAPEQDEDLDFLDGRWTSQSW